MEEKKEDQGTQNNSGGEQAPDVIQIPKTEFEDMKSRADVSSQNFERLKKAEEELNTLKNQLLSEGAPAKSAFDVVTETLDAFSGLSNEERSEIISQAKELKIDPIQFARSKPGQSHLKEFRSLKQAEQTTPNPSSRGKNMSARTSQDILVDPKASDSERRTAVADIQNSKKKGSQAI